MLQIQKNKKLSELSTFAIGGPAQFFAIATTTSEMVELIQFAKEEKLDFLIIGKGSNSLFPDEGYPGLAILNKISFCHVNGCDVHVGAGYSFSLLGIQTARKGFSGLEFASGIPASVGGAIFMNAGANGQETCEALTSVTFVTEDGEVLVFPRSELPYAYRTSIFQKMKGAIVEATFTLTPDPNARERQRKILDYRMKTQPYAEKSVGCIFRNPEGNSAGALIEACGLKGKRVGGAKISELHANFIVSDGSATAKDVHALANYIRERVEKEKGILLEKEVRGAGD